MNSTGVALFEVYDLSQAALSKLANISTRAFCATGGDIVIAGFVLGNNPGDDRIVVRGLGPSLTAAGVPAALANPTLELRDSNGALLVANNDWQDDPAQAAEITAAGLAPTNNLEAAIAAVLPPGFYTALLAGVNSSTGIGLVEVCFRRTPLAMAAQTINLSTRMLVGGGEEGWHRQLYYYRNRSETRAYSEAIGPSLTQFGVPNALADPVLELHGPGAFVTVTNNNWRDTQEAEIQATGLPPTNNLESAIDATLAPGAYTAIVRSR